MIYLNTILSNSTKYDIVVILVFFSELFDEYPIRGSMRKVFFRFLVGTACTLPLRSFFIGSVVFHFYKRPGISKKLTL